ncbi:integral membrane sensor signal transduction histidine kinase [Cellulomonas fimi ATCC 484]|uniref:histidine kinase n=1 Tax=Cellulomonas fimi (strain ATCC 484 / DSM 20113 / JCM 1341 / CCUG 24087 / LMG 16345 / NBRC 15513 / NCIMB 8980 / NCTC 7547 / NRS-133) TaxID=590998 RepID=F4H4X3_CELFA|nr:integral membrane sensor signal transduction histidine kinase [Cellulomonas fimi ATCC 484]VEH29439.1 Sensor protein RstB [Cellulomonas fimi]
MRASLRLRLTALTAGLLMVALAVGALVLTSVLSAGRVAALDEAVRARAQTVADLAAADRVPDPLPVAEGGEIAQLLDADGLVLATSANATRTLPVLPSRTLAALRPASGRTTVVSTTASGYDPDARVALSSTTYRGEPVTAVASLPLGEVRGLVRALRVALVVVVPLLTLLLAGTIWLVIGRALRPVDALRRAAAEVARSGGRGSLPVPPVDDELAALARTLNDMLDRLETSAARQRTFVGDAAHELRSPLASLRAALDVARAHPDAYPTTELVADAEREALRMQGLVDDLLLLARVGSAPLAREDVDLGAVARDVVDAETSAPGPDVEVTGAGRALSDAVATGRVVRNLVGNACRHASARVRVTVADGSVVVEDDGAGIDPADRERVFERFVRLDDAREREAGGSGLGLAIAREMAREQGGDVVLGESDLGGLLARVTLPAP